MFRSAFGLVIKMKLPEIHISGWLQEILANWNTLQFVIRFQKCITTEIIGADFEQPNTLRRI